MDRDQEYLRMFLDESSEYIQMLNENVLVLEQEMENKEVIDSIFRAIHSLKGMSATIGFQTLASVSHKVESILAKIRSNELEVDEDLINLLFEGLDCIESLASDIKQYGKEKRDVSTYLNSLDRYLVSNSELQLNDNKVIVSLSSKEKRELQKRIEDTEAVYEINVLLADECKLEKVRAFMILKRAAEIGELIKSHPTENDVNTKDNIRKISMILLTSALESELYGEFGEIIEVKEVNIEEIDIANIKKETKSKSSSAKHKMDIAPTVRVDINKLDHLMNTVGELLINKTRLEGLEISVKGYADVLQQLDRVTMELHHTVMQIRMEPIGGIFSRFPRMVRDISKELNKDVELIIKGADTELDRSIIDELGDPLMHILRNAVDHGIENPEEREKAGKNKQGTITLKAYQKGSEILIEIKDDGGGIDRKKLANNAIQKGIITAEELENLSDIEILNLVFHPGFSTAKKVSDISGRGVGMDVVKRTVENLDGQISIDSTKGEGSKFILSLPLTLAITQALMVKIGVEVYAIPLGAISETIKVENKDVQKVNGQEVIVLRDNTIPLIEARRLLNLNSEYGAYKNQDDFSVVVVNTIDNQIGLIVDELLTQQEIVIKSLGEYFSGIKNISGATIIGDGEVALILDVRNIA